MGEPVAATLAVHVWLVVVVRDGVRVPVTLALCVKLRVRVDDGIDDGIDDDGEPR